MSRRARRCAGWMLACVGVALGAVSVTVLTWGFGVMLAAVLFGGGYALLTTPARRVA